MLHSVQCSAALAVVLHWHIVHAHAALADDAVVFPIQAGPSHVPHTASLTQSVSLSPDAANLAQTTAASDSLPSDSGDTGLDKARESGTSWGRSSEERRREGSQSEQGGAGRDTKVFCHPISKISVCLCLAKTVVCVVSFCLQVWCCIGHHVGSVCMQAATSRRLAVAACLPACFRCWLLCAMPQVYIWRVMPSTIADGFNKLLLPFSVEEIVPKPAGSTQEQAAA